MSDLISVIYRFLLLTALKFSNQLAGTQFQSLAGPQDMVLRSFGCLHLRIWAGEEIFKHKAKQKPLVLASPSRS